ncbi:hypothetical protein RIF29_21793 [Crotalaria pallida]|uniref:Peptidase S54 rhomboid domain-containing protein n=1 Tax=Crotalaria pallida TaxID=3830 RepID=A0AAN9I7H9_CROPI
MPRTRGRGNRTIVYGRGSRSIEPSLPSPPYVQNPPHSCQSLHSEPQSPGATSTVQPIIGNGQSSTSNQLDSRTDRTARRNVLYVEPADDPKRFNDSKVNRDIISTVIMRMPNPAPVWKRYSEHMATTLLNNFMMSHDFATDYDRRKLVEEEEGNFALWISYILTGVGANLVSWLILPRNAVSVGASGAVFGLFTISVLVKMSWDWRKILEVLILGQFVIEKVMEAAQASASLSGTFRGGYALQSVNHIAHLFGALVGVLLVWLLSKVPSDSSDR